MMRTVFRFSVYLVSALLRSPSGGYIQGNRRQGNEINQQTVQFSHHRESLTRFYNQQKTRLWNIFLKNSLVCTKFIDQKLESFRIVYHEIIIIKYYSILRGTKVMRKNHLSFFLSLFFSRPQSGSETTETFRKQILPLSSLEILQATSFRNTIRVSRAVHSLLDNTAIHWIISARMEDIETCFLPRLLNGGTGSPFRLRLSKHDHCKMSQNAVSAGIVRPARLCKDRVVLVGASYSPAACVARTYTDCVVGLHTRSVCARAHTMQVSGFWWRDWNTWRASICCEKDIPGYE